MNIAQYTSEVLDLAARKINVKRKRLELALSEACSEAHERQTRVPAKHHCKYCGKYITRESVVGEYMERYFNNRLGLEPSQPWFGRSRIRSVRECIEQSARMAWNNRRVCRKCAANRAEFIGDQAAGLRQLGEALKMAQILSDRTKLPKAGNP